MNKLQNSPRLSHRRMLILQAAMQRRSRMVLPLPDGLKLDKRLEMLLASLLRAGLVEEKTTRTSSLAWRQDADGRSLALRLTKQGVQAVVGQTGTERTNDPDSPVAQDTRQAQETTPEVARPAGKLGQVVDAISQADGATLAELVSLTCWQPHTARAALTRLRQRGFATHLDQQNGRKSYRLLGAAQS